MKIQFIKKENSFKKKNFVFHPDLYWELAIFIAFIMIILSFFFGYYLFTQINQEPAPSDNNAGAQVPTVNKDRLEKDLNYFFDRAQKSYDILNSPSPVVDPSL